MKLEANQRFYDNNYLDFVHLQYLAEVMKLVPDVVTTNPNQETVDKYEITVDGNGENPIKITGTDKDGTPTELHVKPEITDRVNELIRDNIKVFNGENIKEWKQINLIKSPEHDYFEISAELKDGNTLNTIVPIATTEDLKQINRIKAYPKKIEVTFLQENADGELEEVVREYDLEKYVLFEDYLKHLENEAEKDAEVSDRLDTLENTQHLNDKACKYLCINHGLVGYNVLYNLGDTAHQLVSFDVDFQGCLNVSLQAGQEWEVECVPTDLTTGTEYNVEKAPVPCQIVLEYEDGTIKYLDATCALTKFKFTVPADAQRGNIKHARFNGILYFD